MASRVRWFGAEVERRVRAQMVRNLNQACAYLRRDIVQTLGIPGPTKTHPENLPSGEGEPPHRRTGTLRRSITSEVDGARLIGRVGSFGARGLEYAVYLELGTRYMAPRPFLVPALDRNRDRLARILAMPIGTAGLVTGVEHLDVAAGGGGGGGG